MFKTGGGAGGGAGTFMLIAGISMWMLLVLVLVLVLVLTLLPPPLEGEPVLPEGAPVEEVVCAVEACWVWAAAVEPAEVLCGAVEEAREVVAGALEDAGEVACPPGDEDWVVETEADCEPGGVVDEVEAQVDDVAAVVEGCREVVVSAPEAVVVTRTQASDEFAPTGDV